MDSDIILNNNLIVIDIDETGLIRLTFTSEGISEDQHIELGALVRGAYERIKEKYPDKDFVAFADLSSAGVPPKSASDIYVRVLSDKRIKRTAIFGMGGAIKSIVSFIVSAAGRGEEVKFFIDKEEAITWLREGQYEGGAK